MRHFAAAVCHYTSQQICSDYFVDDDCEGKVLFIYFFYEERRLANSKKKNKPKTQKPFETRRMSLSLCLLCLQVTNDRLTHTAI